MDDLTIVSFGDAVLEPLQRVAAAATSLVSSMKNNNYEEEVVDTLAIEAAGLRHFSTKEFILFALEAATTPATANGHEDSGSSSDRILHILLLLTMAVKRLHSPFPSTSKKMVGVHLHDIHGAFHRTIGRLQGPTSNRLLLSRSIAFIQHSLPFLRIQDIAGIHRLLQVSMAKVAEHCILPPTSSTQEHSNALNTSVIHAFLTLSSELGMAVTTTTTTTRLSRPDDDDGDLLRFGHAVILALHLTHHPHHLPTVLSRKWILHNHMDSWISLLSPSSINEALKQPAINLAMAALNTLFDQIPSFSLYPSADSLNSLSDHLIQTIVSSTSQQLTITRFNVFKKWYRRIGCEDAREEVIRRLVVESRIPPLIVAGLTLLHDECVAGRRGERRVYVKEEDEDEVKPSTRAPAVTRFASMYLRDTHLAVLLTLNSEVYTNTLLYPSQTILTSLDLLIERHDILMHALNLYLYLLMSDKRGDDDDGVLVWGVRDSMHMESIEKKTLKPLSAFTTQCLDTQSTDPSAMMKLQLLLMVVHRIQHEYEQIRE